MVNDVNQGCPSGKHITDEEDCLGSAAAEFGFCSESSGAWYGYRHGCLLHETCEVYFNSRTSLDQDGKSHAICKESDGTTTVTGKILIY